jgi:hypothetical protein
MGRFFIEAKSFEFIIESWGDSLRLRIVERGKGYLHSMFLEKEGASWLLSTINETARDEDNPKLFRKFIDSFFIYK